MGGGPPVVVPGLELGLELGGVLAGEDGVHGAEAVGHAVELGDVLALGGGGPARFLAVLTAGLSLLLGTLHRRCPFVGWGRRATSRAEVVPLPSQFGAKSFSGRDRSLRRSRPAGFPLPPCGGGLGWGVLRAGHGLGPPTLPSPTRGEGEERAAAEARWARLRPSLGLGPIRRDKATPPAGPGSAGASPSRRVPPVGLPTGVRGRPAPAARAADAARPPSGDSVLSSPPSSRAR